MLSEKKDKVKNNEEHLFPSVDKLKEEGYLRKDTRKSINVPFSVLKGKQRKFDRHSGTGRGKEISKQGAGSKTVWGNDVLLAKKEILNEGLIGQIEDKLIDKLMVDNSNIVNQPIKKEPFKYNEEQFPSIS